LKPGRVLLLSYEFAPFRGGIARVAEALAAGGAGLGHDVHVLAPDYHADQSATDRSLPFTVHRFTGDFCSLLSLDKLTGFARLCRRTVARLEPELVHATDPQSHMALTLLARLRAARPFSVTVHGTELLRYRRETVPRLWMRGAFRRPRAIFPVSMAVRERLLDTFEADPARVRVAYPAVAPLWFDAPRADRLAVRRALGLPADAFVLLTVARRVPEKGHARVIDGIGGLPENLRSRIVYVVAGTGPDAYVRQLDEAAASCGARMVLTGETGEADTVALVDAADVFIMTSRETPARLEGFGIALVEAAARGLAAIATDTGGVREAVLHNETGYLIPEHSEPETLIHTIRLLLEEPDRLLRMGDLARRHARRFTRERLARDVLTNP